MSKELQPQSNILRKSVATVAAIGAIGGAVYAEQEHGIVDRIPSIEEVADVGITVRPEVSSAGTEALISGNDMLRDVGTPILLFGLAAYGSLAVARTRRESLSAGFDYINATRDRGIAQKVLPAAIIAAVASASALGDEASRGANEPVRILSSSISEAGQNPAVIVQHDNYIPFNHGEVRTDSLASIKSKLIESAKAQQNQKAETSSFSFTAKVPFKQEVNPENIDIVPFVFALGSQINPENETNPSSAPITALPAAHIKAATGVDLSKKSSDCSDNKLIVGEQINARPGERVVVQGQSMEVAKTIDALAGLDRVVAIGSLEQLQGCVLGKESVSGAVVTGVNNLADIESQMKELGLDYSATDFAQIKEAYADFWDRSVKPVEMLLILQVLGIGAASAAYMRSSQLLRNKQVMASLIAEGGVPKQALKRAENIRALKAGVYGTALATVPLVGLTAMTNSSQYGLEQAADVKSLGAGFLAFMVVSAATTRSATKNIDEIDAVKELRS